LSECTLYVTLEPCAMCSGATAWSQMGKVVFGASDPKGGYSKYSPTILHPKTQVINGILEEECLAIIQDYFKTKRK